MSKVHAACVACVMAMACQNESWKDDYTFVWHGEYVSVYGHDRTLEEACGGSFTAIDTHTEAILELFGSQKPIHYDYRWMSEEFFEGHCAKNSLGCAPRGEPKTPSIPHLHEVTHAVTYAAWDNACPALLNEGLATYFSEPQFKRGDAIPDPSLIRGGLLGDLSDRPATDADYTVAGHFASFLVEEFGFPAIEDLCRAMPNHPIVDEEDWARAVQEVLGVPLDELLTKYESYPLCTQQQYAARAWECAGEPDVTYMNEKMTFTVETDCASERVIGPIAGKAFTTRRVWFPEDSHYVSVMVLQADPPGQLRLFMTQECVPCSAEPQVFRTDGLPPLYRFRAGMHEFIFSFDLDQTQPLKVTLGPAVGG